MEFIFIKIFLCLYGIYLHKCNKTKNKIKSILIFMKFIVTNAIKIFNFLCFYGIYRYKCNKIKLEIFNFLCLYGIYLYKYNKIKIK